MKLARGSPPFEGEGMGVGSLHVLHMLRRNKNSTEYRFTLHGVSAYAPRSIGLRSTEYRLTLHGASAYAPRGVKPSLLG